MDDDTVNTPNLNTSTTFDQQPRAILAGDPTPNITFTPHQKPYLMIILETRDNQSTLEGHVTTLRETTPVTIQTRVQSIINDIYMSSSSLGSNWNYIAFSLFSEIYQQTFISKIVNNFHFEKYNGTTNPKTWDKNASDIEPCHLFPRSLCDAALCWLTSLPQ